MNEAEVMIEVVRMITGLGLIVEDVNWETGRILVSIPKPKP
jgi:hypothetical protein